jgi:HEAT repeat protein
MAKNTTEYRCGCPEGNLPLCRKILPDAVSTLNGYWIPAVLISTLGMVLICSCASDVEKPMNWPEPANFRDLIHEATTILEAALDDQDPMGRINAIEAVAVTGQIRYMPKVQAMLTDNLVPVRFAAAMAIGDIQYLLGQSNVRPLLSDENENVRIAAAYALFRLGDQQAFEVLRHGIASNDPVIRANASWALGKTGDPKALKLLYIALQMPDSSDNVKFQAVESIAMLKDERIYQKALAMSISAYIQDRVVAAKALGALGTSQAAQTLLTLLDDDIVEVRLKAAEQLGALGYASGESAVIDVFRKNLTGRMVPQDKERVYVLSAFAIGKICTPGLKDFLPQLLKDQSKVVRLAAAKAVLQCTQRAERGQKPSA